MNDLPSPIPVPMPVPRAQRADAWTVAVLAMLAVVVGCSLLVLSAVMGDAERARREVAEHRYNSRIEHCASYALVLEAVRARIPEVETSPVAERSCSPEAIEELRRAIP